MNVRRVGLAITSGSGLRSRGVPGRFVLVGPPESGAIPPGEVRHWQHEGIVEYLGPVLDVRPQIEACSVYVLPSYREGRPRTVLEAMAMGRAIITTTAPGCRQTVHDGDNGLLVEPGNVSALVAAMLRFVDDSSLVVAMGRKSREMAEEMYDINRVNAIVCRELGISGCAPPRGKRLGTA